LRVALEMARVERVYPAFALQPIPRGPEILLGIARLAGDMVAAVDLRSRLGQPRIPLQRGQAFVLARSARRRLILVADSALGLLDIAPGDILPAPEVAPGLGKLTGVVQGQDGLLWIQDLDAFLDWEEEEAIAAALAAETPPSALNP
jgi:purine-binding chemotaxis protein CheW